MAFNLNSKTRFLCCWYEVLMVNRLHKKKSKMAMCGKIEMELPFPWYTANHLIVQSQIICSVLNKWHSHFYLSAHSKFGLFSCLAYLPSKLHMKNIKTLFLDLDLNHLYRGSSYNMNFRAPLNLIALQEEF